MSQVDFSHIRSYNGSQNLGFEELCCQLAALEPRPPTANFIRKGRGPDQGVECFVTLPDGGEIAWQAKYFLSSFDDSQVRNLDESLTRALTAHPKLQTYIICLPIDLSDLRPKTKLSQLQRYMQWRDSHIEQAKLAGIQLQIHLWGASQLQERLMRDTTLYAGRLRYWFDEQRLSTDWFASRFEISKENLGQRYTPESHVDLPVQQALHAIARDENFPAQVKEWNERLSKDLGSVFSTQWHADLQDVRERLRVCAAALMASLDQRIDDSAREFPLSAWTQLAAGALEAVTSVFSASETLPDPTRRDVDHVLYPLYNTVQKFIAMVEHDPWPLLNEQSLLVVGEAGAGKSHLLAEFGARQIASRKPFVLVLTQTLVDADPWPQILQQLDLSDCTASEFLGALDAAAEAAGVRAVIAIDALNERHGLQLWRDRLAGFIKSIEAFPRVSIVLSLRSTYVDHLPVQKLPKVVHRGFAGHAGAGAKAYLDVRGIARPSSPNLLREFENPLFLRTCCDYLDAENLKAIPKGLLGISTLFEFYLKAIASRIELKLGLDRYQRIPLTAVNAFVLTSSQLHNAGSVSKAEAMEVFEKFLPSHGLEGRSLFGALLIEGVLTLDVVNSVETVRFTFERLSDHLIAKKLLDENFDPAAPKESFARQPLKAFVSDDGWWGRAGIVEALAIQLPERCTLEILDVAPSNCWEARFFEEAFENSLLWRSQDRFSPHTMDWVSKLADQGCASVYGVLIRIATEPDNAFNAEELHRRLASVRMPERDAEWSVFLAMDDMSEGGPVESLIDWAWEVRPEEVEADRLLLASIVLTWFLSTSNRAVRDMATKGLAHILSRRLATGVTLLRKFASVDDPYVIERLLAACYGAALQGADLQGLDAMCKQVWMQFFENRQPPMNLLSRDYAQGILEYTAHFSNLPPGIDLGVCQNCVNTQWPLEDISEEMLARYRVGGPHGYRDDILSSTDQHGDFAHYSVRHAIFGWANLPRCLAGQTTEQIYSAWEDRFQESATEPQLEALVDTYRVAREYREIGHSWDDDKRQERDNTWTAFQEKEAIFLDLLEPDQRADYLLAGHDFLLEATRMGRREISPPMVDPTDVCRWVCWRAHELGWTEELFSEFERSSKISRDRIGNHRVERVGKKYQRIALGEVITRFADHLARDEGDGLLGAYTGTLSQLSMLRDLDPSMLVRETRETGWAYTPKTWWTPATPNLEKAPAKILLAWLDSPDEGFVNGSENIEATDPIDRRDWLVVSAFRHWNIGRRNQQNHPEAWSRITCLITKKGQGQKLIDELLSADRSNDNLLDEDKGCCGFLGEHGWREPAKGPPPLRENSWAGIKVKCMTTAAELLAESNTSDNSIRDTFTLDLPSAWLVKAMNLRLRSGQGAAYVDSNNIVLFMDPSLKERGASAGLVDRQRFLEALDAADLEPIWTIAGEKNVYAADCVRQGFGGRVTHLIAYRLINGVFEASPPRLNKSSPNAGQLSALFDHESSAEKLPGSTA
jgi:hypothetical protein